MFKALLSRGFFPRELPPTFTTAGFGEVVNAAWGTMAPVFRGRGATQIRHSLARTGALRRLLSIPNPIPYANLCAEVAAGWQEIEAQCLKGGYSLSRPQSNPLTGRSVLPQVPIQSDLVPHRASVRAGARFLLRADISRFYGSVYTHSVPWALHSKKVAKASRRDTALLGNRLDTCLRNTQDSQTIGIPIGPDASLVVAEVLLSAVDARLAARAGVIRGLRYIDDYELAFESRGAAEEGLGALEQALGEFELELNPRKTSIEELPAAHEHSWVSAIRGLSVRNKGPGQATDLVHLFDSAFGFAHREAPDPVLRYLAGRLKGIDVQESNRRLFQHLLLQCAMAEPGTIPQLLALLITGKAAGWSLESDLVAETLNRILGSLLPMGCGNEAAWCLWGLFALELPLDGSNLKAISSTDDPFVALLALHGQSEGLLQTLDTSNWSPAVAEGGLWEHQWILAYEACVQGWIPPASGPNPVMNDPAFRILAEAGVRFFDGTKIKGVVPTGVAPSVGTAPLFSL